MKLLHFIVLIAVVSFVGLIVLGGMSNYKTEQKVIELMNSAGDRMNVDFEKQSIAEIKTNFSAAEMYLVETIDIVNGLSESTDTDKAIKYATLEYAELLVELIQAMNTDFIQYYQHIKEIETYTNQKEWFAVKIAAQSAVEDLDAFSSKTTSILDRMRNLDVTPLDVETRIAIMESINNLEEMNGGLNANRADLQRLIDSIR